jgi:riboflavin kinase/FMN adenylyltransferase
MAQLFGFIQQASLKDTWLTIGTFDGVHVGHQEIVRGLAAGAHATRSQAVVVTFHPHPAAVVRKQAVPNLLTMPDERAEYLSEAGADVVIIQPFDQQVAGTSAVDFLTLLKKHLGFNHFWVGYDFTLGHNREGDVDRLRELGHTLDYEIKVIPPVQADGHIISSSYIRGLLREGKVAQAAQELGRMYRISGDVIKGDGRGRALGIPTANLMLPHEKFIPGAGVYACIARVGALSLPAAVNIGVRPTFDGETGGTHIEAHLLDYEGDLYGQQVSLHFLAHLRGEKKFASIQALIEQVQADIQKTRELAEEHIQAG